LTELLYIEEETETNGTKEIADGEQEAEEDEQNRKRAKLANEYQNGEDHNDSEEELGLYKPFLAK
jgi:hypothetical protein